MEIFIILRILMLIILSMAVVLTIIYVIPVIAVKRFHTTNHLLTANFCSAIGLAALFWIINNTITAAYPSIDQVSSAYCMFLRIGPDLFNSLGLYALTMISVNRFLIVAYPNKRLFKQSRWFFISAAIQWIIVILMNIPKAVFAVLVSLTLLKV